MYIAVSRCNNFPEIRSVFFYKPEIHPWRSHGQVHIAELRGCSQIAIHCTLQRLGAVVVAAAAAAAAAEEWIYVVEHQMLHESAHTEERRG